MTFFVSPVYASCEDSSGVGSTYLCTVLGGYVYEMNAAEGIVGPVSGVSVKMESLAGGTSPQGTVDTVSADGNYIEASGTGWITIRTKADGHFRFFTNPNETHPGLDMRNDSGNKYRFTVTGVPVAYTGRQSLTIGYQKKTDGTFTAVNSNGWTLNSSTNNDTPYKSSSFDQQLFDQLGNRDLNNDCSNDIPSQTLDAYRCNFGLFPAAATPTTGATAALSTLRIKEDTGTGAVTGTYGASKRRATEGGTNIYNALEVTQLVSGGADGNYKLVATAFVDKNTSCGSTLASLRTCAAANNGFVLLYSNAGGTADGRTFQAKRYYVYYNGQWSNPLNLSLGESFGGQLGGLSVQPKNTIREKSQGVPYSEYEAPTFSVTLFTNISQGVSRTWGNYSYFMNNSNAESVTIRSGADGPLP